MNSALKCVWFYMFTSNFQFANKLFFHIFSSMTELWKLQRETFMSTDYIFVLTIAFKFVFLPTTVCDKKSSVKELP